MDTDEAREAINGYRYCLTSVLEYLKRNDVEAHANAVQINLIEAYLANFRHV
jgi:hypothetical protein